MRISPHFFESKILAAELASADIREEYIIDAAIGNHIQQTNAVVVVADTIHADDLVLEEMPTTELGGRPPLYPCP